MGDPQLCSAAAACDHDARAFELLEKNKHVPLREAVRKARIEVDSDDHMRRALLAHSRPTRGPWPPGSLVHFYRKQRPAKGQRPAIRRWHGVRRVIGHDAPSNGAGRAQGHSIWLKYQG